MRLVVPGLSAFVLAHDSSNVHVLVCAGPPLHETVKLLSPLAKLEELRLSGNESGRAIPTDVAVFTSLKTLDLSEMGLEGELSTCTERFDFLFGWFLLTFIKILSRQAASRKSSRT